MSVELSSSSLLFFYDKLYDWLSTFFLSGYTLTYLRYVHIMYVIHIKYTPYSNTDTHPIPPPPHHTSRLDRFFFTVWSPQLKSPVKRTSRERMEREKKYDFHPHLHHHQNIIVSWDTRFKKIIIIFFFIHSSFLGGDL